MTGELERLLGSSRVALVVIKGVRGSAPREAGAFMLVTETAIFGTIGGGRLEFMAIDEARDVLASPDGQSRQAEVPLGPEIGQCCGGHVGFEVSLLDEVGKQALAQRERERCAALPQVFVFGSGHVGRALARGFALLPVQLKLIDSREEELARAPDVVKHLTPLPEAELQQAKKGAAVLIATHDHGLDYLIAKEALARRDLAYVGMIGSKTKRAKFESWAQVDSAALHCPMAARYRGDRRPEVIAAFVVAEVMSALTQQENVKQPAVEIDNE